jgi:hypothetical protein
VTGLHRDQVIPEPSSKPSLVRSYLGTEPRRLGILAAIVIGTTLVFTLGYIVVVGYDKWSSNVAAANHMMWAAYQTPVAGACPRVVAGPVAPGVATPSPPTAPTAMATPGRQYVCPSCGATLLPRWTAAGQPVCPVCGGPMMIAFLRPEIELAAAP